LEVEMPVIKGSRAHREQQKAQQAEVLESGHPAGYQKLRCSACKVGMAEMRLDAVGKPEYYCARCHRSFKVSAI
jgi:hypothetical protein